MKHNSKKASKNEGFRGKKSLGQHFLEDREAKFRITRSLHINSSDVLVEVGPGRGEITRSLVKEAFRVIVIEKDRRCIPILKSLGAKNLEIVEGDALKDLPLVIGTLKTGRYKLVGNIPYYITGKLLRIIGDLPKAPDIIVLTMQKEVAERLSAEPGSMNLLAAAVQAWGLVEIVGNISKKSFSPPPKVDSSIVKITPRSQKGPKIEMGNYYKTIRAAFKQPRKTLFNNLRELSLNNKDLESILDALKLNKNARPQELSVKDLLEISKLINAKK